MDVYSVRFTNPGQDEIEVGSNLGDFYLPWPCRSWHRQAIHSWLEAGNKIRPFRRDDNPDQLRQALTRELYAQASRLLESITGEYAIAEQIIWPDLEREARRFLLDGTIGPLMQSALEEEGRSCEELAYAIIHKAIRLTRFRGQVIQARAKHLKHIRTAELDELEVYDVAAHWPAVPEE